MACLRRLLKRRYVALSPFGAMGTSQCITHSILERVAWWEAPDERKHRGQVSAHGTHVPAEKNLRDVQGRLVQRLQGARHVPLVALPVNPRAADHLDPTHRACVAGVRAMNKFGTSRGSTAILATGDQGREFQLTKASAANGTDLAASLSVKGRYGPRQRLSIRLGDGLRCEASGQAPPATLPAVTQVVDDLRLVDEPLLASEIAAEIDSELKTVQNALTKVISHPAFGISRIGTGTKNDPYRDVLEDAALAS